MNLVHSNLFFISYLNLIQYNISHGSGIRPLFRTDEVDRGNSRIINGVGAQLGEAPWQVSFADKKGHYCSGSIISHKTVVTAAHCVDEMAQELKKFGKYLTHIKYGGINRLKLRRTNSVSKVIMHPDYIFKATSHVDADIALVHLKIPVVETPYVKIIEIAHTTPKPGTKALITGWGYDKVNRKGDGRGKPSIMLQKSTMTIMRRKRCNAMTKPLPPLNGSFICARNRNSSGDSGGPLVVNNRLIGVMSSSIDCFRGSPSDFTSAVVYRTWIKKNTI